MDNYGLILELVDRANTEILAHKKANKEHPYWPSGHKNKAKRAIMMAREILMEAAKELEDAE